MPDAPVTYAVQHRTYRPGGRYATSVRFQDQLDGVTVTADILRVYPDVDDAVLGEWKWLTGFQDDVGAFDAVSAPDAPALVDTSALVPTHQRYGLGGLALDGTQWLQPLASGGALCAPLTSFTLECECIPALVAAGGTGGLVVGAARGLDRPGMESRPGLERVLRRSHAAHLRLRGVHGRHDLERLDAERVGPARPPRPRDVRPRRQHRDDAAVPRPDAHALRYAGGAARLRHGHDADPVRRRASVGFRGHARLDSLLEHRPAASATSTTPTGSGGGTRSSSAASSPPTRAACQRRQLRCRRDGARRRPGRHAARRRLSARGERVLAPCSTRWSRSATSQFSIGHAISAWRSMSRRRRR